MNHRIELIAGEAGTVLVMIDGDHYTTARDVADAWEIIARHLAGVLAVNIVSYLK